MKLRFINYRKETKGKYPIRGWFPRFKKYWYNEIWLLTWRGFAVELDFRADILGDMMNDRKKRKNH